MFHIEFKFLKNLMIMEELQVVHSDTSITSKRNQKQREQLLELQTVFPYEFIGCLGYDFIKEDPYFLLGAKFPALSRKSTRISQGHVHKLNTFLSLDACLSNFHISFHLQNKLSDCPNFSRVYLLCMQKKIETNNCLIADVMTPISFLYLRSLDPFRANVPINPFCHDVEKWPNIL